MTYNRLYLTEEDCYFKNSQNIPILKLYFAGQAIIQDLTPNNYILKVKDKELTIYQYKKGDALLENLFSYKGVFKIIKARGLFTDKKFRQIRVVEKKFSYLSQNIETNAEDMGLLSEEMGLKKPFNITKTKVYPNIINNMSGRTLYKEDGSTYSGLVHYYLDGPNSFKYFSGGIPNDDSELLSIKKLTSKIKLPAANKDVRSNYLTIERGQAKTKGKKNVIY